MTDADPIGADPVGADPIGADPRAQDAQAGLVRAFRAEYRRTVAILLRSLRDLDAAEDAVQEAFAAAAASWPRDGMPPNPQAWIVTAARRRALDRLRRSATAERHTARLPPPVTGSPTGDPDDGDLDDELRLVLLCAHPALSPPSQVALTLRFVGGLTAAEIARAFGTTEATMAQRLSRAKAKVRDAGIGIRLPRPEQWRERVDVALAVGYAIFNEGYLATSGDLARGELAQLGIHLARQLHTLAPEDPEASGLLALMLLIHGRDRARRAEGGILVPLPEQDRTRWDRALLSEGQRLARDCVARNEPGPYQIQAAIQAVHCDAATDADTDWAQILQLYDQLLTWVDTPACRTARAVAVAAVHGPTAGIDALEQVPESHYTLAVRATLLLDLGDPASAREAFERAAGLAGNDGERAHLRRRAEAIPTEDRARAGEPGPSSVGRRAGPE